MSVGYEEIEEMLNQVFASRLKNVSPKHLAVWVNEIARKNYTKNALEKCSEEYLDDESLELNLPTMLKTLNKYNVVKATKGLFSCKYCEGRGYVYNNLKFANNGDFLSHNYALVCYCNNNNTDMLKFQLNEETNNKTLCKDGYFLVFKDVVEYWNYLDKVYANNGKDLWVKEVENGEVVEESENVSGDSNSGREVLGIDEEPYGDEEMPEM